MIKLMIQLEDGKRALILGLSDGNLAQLKRGHPLVIAGRDIGLSEVAHIVINWGPNEKAILSQLRDDGISLVIDDAAFDEHGTPLKGFKQIGPNGPDGVKT